jgi:hypothetical protein
MFILPLCNEDLLAFSNLRSPRLQTDKLRLNHCYVSNYRRLREVWESSQDKPNMATDFHGSDEAWNEGISDI